jgi:hypothetical protein
MKIMAIAILSTLVFSGCVSLQPISLSGITTERRIAAEDIVLIKFAGLGAAHVDTLYGGKVPVATGEVWKQAFVGDEKSEWTFTITKSALERSIAGAGFTMRSTYQADGLLRGAGREFEVHAEGSRAAAMDFNGAMRQAVELAVADAAKQCRAIIAQAK